MRLHRPIAAVLLMLGALLPVSAQTSPVAPNTIQRNTDGRIVRPERPPTADVGNVGTPRPDRAERTLPPEVREKVLQFEVAREAFIKRQEELRKRLNGANTEKEREAIRETIKDSLNQWREQARQFRDDARERLKELQRELPNLREALQEGPAGGVKPGGRPRPGIE